MDKREHVRKLPPLASSEDLSEDLLDSPEADTKNKCLEDIEEVPNTPAKSVRQQTLCLAMPNTPRIDISRASSSSHHDDSSPERDLFVGESNKIIYRYIYHPNYKYIISPISVHTRISPFLYENQYHNGASKLIN